MSKHESKKKGKLDPFRGDSEGEKAELEREAKAWEAWMKSLSKRGKRKGKP